MLIKVPVLFCLFTKHRRKWFNNRYGIEVDDFVVDVDDSTHQALHAGKSALKNKAGWWDHELVNRIKKAEKISGQKLTRSEMIGVGNEMLIRFGLDPNKVHRATR